MTVYSLADVLVQEVQVSAMRLEAESVEEGDACVMVIGSR